MPIIRPPKGFLDDPNVIYIKSQIETGQLVRTKKALQHICKVYREGYRIRPPQLVGVEQSIVGLLYTQGKDEKVRRWALNTLAQLGREATCIEAVLQVLAHHGNEPATAAAGIAVIYKISRDPTELLRRLGFDGQMIALAALQHVDARELDLSSLPLNVEKAPSELLKLALIVVGLERAPVHMLNPRHTNAEMVKALGGHHDSIVSQYTVWAITENHRLGIGDLGIDIRTIEDQQPNVRNWLLQLITMTSETAAGHVDYIVLGMGDPAAEARAGLAIGLRDTFFDGLEPLALDWFTTEHDADISQLILDHIVRQSCYSPSYEDMAKEVYEKEAPGSSLRQRMDANAAGRPIYAEFKRISLDGWGDLFRGGPNVTNINIGGNVVGGAVSVGGDAQASGSTSVHYNPQTVELIQSELSKAEREVHALTLDETIKREALEHIQSAKAEPTPDRINKAIAVLEKVAKVTEAGVSVGTALAPIATALAKAAGLL